MHPTITRAGRYTFLGCGSFLVLGVTLSIPALIAIASAGAILLAFAYIQAVPVARRARREKLEFAWWLERSHVQSGAVVPGVPFEVRCYLRNRGPRPIRVADFRPELSSQQVSLVPGPRALQLNPRARVSFRFSMKSHTAGRLTLHGFALFLTNPLGLFHVRLYFPNPLGVRVLPRSGGFHSRNTRLATGVPTESARLALARRRGSGTELHELRDLLPGDPYRSIAWKASGRLGKWVVKEVEQEVQNTLWLVVDISGTMRHGEWGERPLDRAIEWAASQADSVLKHGGQVGLITFDSRVVSVVDCGEGSSHRLRIYEALLDSTEVTDADLTEEDDDAVAQIIAGHLRQQEGIALPRAAPKGSSLADMVATHLRAELIEESRRELSVDASSGDLLRAYCKSRGLALTHRAEPKAGSKAVALQVALMRAAGRRREPALMHVVTDFATVRDPAPVIAAMKFLRGRHHRIEFSLPEGPPEQRFLNNIKAAHEALAYRQSERRRRTAYRLLSPLGARVSVLPAIRVEGTPSS